MTAAFPKLAIKFAGLHIEQIRKRCAAISLFTYQHALFLGGLAGIAYGAWMIYHPAGAIVGGWMAVKVSMLIEEERK